MGADGIGGGLLPLDILILDGFPEIPAETATSIQMPLPTARLMKVITAPRNSLPSSVMIALTSQSP